jgi:hypothetical protein
MKDLTEEEYDARDEKWMKNTPKIGPNGTGFFAQRKAENNAADKTPSRNYHRIGTKRNCGGIIKA